MLIGIIAAILGVIYQIVPSSETSSPPPSPSSSAQDVVSEGDVLHLRAEPPSVLVVALDPWNLSTSSETAVKLLSETKRRNQHLVVVCGQKAIHASTAPTGENIIERISAPDPSKWPDGTQVRAAAERKYQRAQDDARRKVSDQEQQQLASWVDSAKAPLEHATCPATDPAQAFSAAMDQAKGTFSSLAEAKVNVGQHKTIVVLGVDGVPLTPFPAMSGQDLEGATVVICPFPGGPQEQAGWQAALVQGGVGRAVLLTPGAVPELPHVVTEGLRGTVFNLSADAVFAVGSSALEAAGKVALKDVLDDLLGKDKDANVVVNGYTDNLPSLQGNDRLSQDRDDAVRQWLIENGVPAAHIQAIGHGDREPIAPDGPGGQPLNRRVIVVINPPA
jgi:outer membrane protein OmpA-like peptidoglycan-associated protein